MVTEECCLEDERRGILAVEKNKGRNDSVNENEASGLAMGCHSKFQCTSESSIDSRWH